MKAETLRYLANNTIYNEFYFMVLMIGILLKNLSILFAIILYINNFLPFFPPKTIFYINVMSIYLKG